MEKIEPNNNRNIYRTSIGYPYDFSERVIKNDKPYSFDDLLNDGFMVIFDVVGKEDFHSQFWDLIKTEMEVYDRTIIGITEMPQNTLDKYYGRIRKSGGLGKYPIRILQMLSWSHELFSIKGGNGKIIPRIYEVKNTNLPKNCFTRHYILTNNEELYIEDIFENIMKMHREKLSTQISQSLKEDNEKNKMNNSGDVIQLLDRIDKTTQETNRNTKFILEIVKKDPHQIKNAIDKILENNDITAKDKGLLNELKNIERISDWAERSSFWSDKVKLLTPKIVTLLINYLN